MAQMPKTGFPALRRTGELGRARYKLPLFFGLSDSGLHCVTNGVDYGILFARRQQWLEVVAGADDELGIRLIKPTIALVRASYKVFVATRPLTVATLYSIGRRRMFCFFTHNQTSLSQKPGPLYQQSRARVENSGPRRRAVKTSHAKNKGSLGCIGGSPRRRSNSSILWARRLTRFFPCDRCANIKLAWSSQIDAINSLLGVFFVALFAIFLPFHLRPAGAGG